MKTCQPVCFDMARLTDRTDHHDQRSEMVAGDQRSITEYGVRILRTYADMVLGALLLPDLASTRSADITQLWDNLF